MASFQEDFANALRFTKLNGSNYRTWAFNMRLYLESVDHYEFVDATAEPSEEDEDGIYSTELKAFVERAKKVSIHICFHLNPKQQIHIRVTETAKETWYTMKKISLLGNLCCRKLS